jgi:hypothetical protein
MIPATAIPNDKIISAMTIMIVMPGYAVRLATEPGSKAHGLSGQRSS